MPDAETAEAPSTFEYKTVTCDGPPDATLQIYAESGWRLVSVLHGQLSHVGHAPAGCTLFFERPMSTERLQALENQRRSPKQRTTGARRLA